MIILIRIISRIFNIKFVVITIREICRQNSWGYWNYDTGNSRSCDRVVKDEVRQWRTIVTRVTNRVGVLMYANAFRGRGCPERVRENSAQLMDIRPATEPQIGCTFDCTLIIPAKTNRLNERRNMKTLASHKSAPRSSTSTRHKECGYDHIRWWIRRFGRCKMGGMGGGTSVKFYPFSAGNGCSLFF
jgi:hypothetical protein